MYRGGKKHRKNKHKDKEERYQYVPNKTKKKDKRREMLSETQMQELLSQFKLNDYNKAKVLGYAYRYN